MGAAGHYQEGPRAPGEAAPTSLLHCASSSGVKSLSLPVEGCLGGGAPRPLRLCVDRLVPRKAWAWGGGDSGGVVGPGRRIYGDRQERRPRRTQQAKKEGAGEACHSDAVSANKQGGGCLHLNTRP